MFRSLFLSFVLVFSLSSLLAVVDVKAATDATGVNKENFLLLKTKYGTALIVLYPKKAAKHVKRVKKLVREKFYDGLKFHRVIPGFMAQTGDPKGDGTGGSKYPNLRAEFNNVFFNRGVIGAARSQNPHSANSQFFICFQASPHLNRQYTVWGKVVHGMETIDRIKPGGGPNGMVQNPDKILSLRVLADVREKDQPTISLQQFVPGNEKKPRKKILPRIE